jgi:hypothetical protein
MNDGDRNMSWMMSSERIRKLGIHASETAWVGTKFDYVLSNNSSIDDLFKQVDLVLDVVQA